VRISKRQQQILGLAASGLTDKQIAERLSVSISTVRTHLRRFYRTNDVRNKSEAVAAYLRFMQSTKPP
jgi:DNA-binding CsgD family transcriptional regulator